MKKSIIVCICILSCMLISGCGNDAENSSDNENTSSFANGSAEESICTETTFDSLDKLADYIIENKDHQFKSIFENSARAGNSESFSIYTLSDIPEGYSLNKIRTSDYSNFISMDYICGNNSDRKKITFVWGFNCNDDGSECLNTAISSIGLSTMPGYPGFYYIQTVDDLGVSIYQIYWIEDNYYFQANIPAELISLSDNSVSDLSVQKMSDISVQKNEYSIYSEN